jgi:uncharacterized lipoprotein YajG
MTTTRSRFSLALGLVLLGGTTMLAGCGSSPTPVSQTTTTERTTTMAQPPPMATSTTTTTQQTQRP